jgi:hypothetical protein
VAALRRLAVTKFKHSVDPHWDHEDLSHAIHVVYHSTPDDVTDLRDIIAETVYSHFEELDTEDAFKAVVSSTASLAYGLLERFFVTKGLRCPQGHPKKSLIRGCRFCRYTAEVCRVCYDKGKTAKSCRNCGNDL